MLGKLYHSVAVVSIAIVLAGGALMGLLYGTGKLTGERLETIASVLRGELDESGVGEAVEPETKQPEDEPAAKSASSVEIRQQRRDEQLWRAVDERAYRDRMAQRELLDQALQHLITAEERFEQDQARWQAELERRRGQVLDEGFAKELKIVSKLPPKIAKEHIVLKWKESPADAVRMLNALPESTTKRILGQMKTAEEVQITHELLERLSTEKIDQFKPRSGKTAGN